MTREQRLFRSRLSWRTSGARLVCGASVLAWLLGAVPLTWVDPIVIRVGGNDHTRHRRELFHGVSMARLFAEHGMELLGPPMLGKWEVSEDGRITRTA